MNRRKFVGSLGLSLALPSLECFGSAKKDVKRFADKYVTSDHHRELLEKYNYPEDKIHWRIQDILNYNPDRDTRFSLSGNSFVGGAGEHFPIKEGQQEGQPIVQYNLLNPHPFPVDQVVSHEWGHIPVSSGFNPLSEEERNEYVTRLKPGSVRNAHDAEPQENRADQFELRYFLDKEGIYDSSTGERFTQKHLDDYREKTGTHHRMFNLYDDEDIIWLMNNIAAVDDGKELNIAQDGGEYKKWLAKKKAYENYLKEAAIEDKELMKWWDDPQNQQWHKTHNDDVNEFLHCYREIKNLKK